MSTVSEIITAIQKWGIEYFHRYYSMYQGIVVDNDDPQRRGRLKLRIPEITGDDLLDYWAVSKGIPAGHNFGEYFLPKIGDTVWVEFEKGSARFPVWTPGWFGEEDSIADRMTYPHINIYLLKTKAGQLFLMDEEKDTIMLKNVEGLKAILSQNGIFVGMNDANSQPAVLGDNNEEILNSLRQMVFRLKTNMQVLSTAFLPTPSGAANIALVISDLTLMETELAQLALNIPKTKSENVNLD